MSHEPEHLTDISSPAMRGQCRRCLRKSGYLTTWDHVERWYSKHRCAIKISQSQTLTNVHPDTECEGRGCCIHHPSDHHMKTWPLYWRADRGIMERICEHGVGHPDPDDASACSIHGCDGCCHPPATKDPS